MKTRFPLQWFDMTDVRRRKLAAGIWIPLRQAENLASGSEKWKIGHFEDSSCAGSLAVFLDKRELGEKLGWSEIGLIHSPGPYAFSSGSYKPADSYWYNDKEPVGIELVVINQLNGAHRSEWLVNQDLVIALGLIQEGDKWLRVDEGYIDVIRQRRDADGRTVAIEIRAEHLRDYLNARGLALRIAQYRERFEVVETETEVPWNGDQAGRTVANERLELRTFTIDDSGGAHGGSVGVFNVRRTDVDLSEDVPVFGPENAENTESSNYTFERGGRSLVRVEGALWREEWVEPAAQSERVRGDEPEEQLYYSVGAGGVRVPASKLDSEDVGQYLWFKAEVIESLLSIRGSSLDWFSGHTGSVSCSPDYSVNFGVNSASRINVYAYDVARLPMWQQRVWHGFNISPDGAPSSELLSAQMDCNPASTNAPESALPVLLGAVDTAFERTYGFVLFQRHEHTDRILKSCHRFRALRDHGVLSLAKDIARITADSIDTTKLLTIIPLARGEQKVGGLKALERVLSKHVGREEAYRIMGPFHIVYGLRLGDAHLPSGEIGSKLDQLGVAADDHSLSIGEALLARVCDGLAETIGALAVGATTEPG